MSLTSSYKGKEMIGIILAAGIGSRLRPMTNDKPKCLVKSAGKPLLEYQLDAYQEAGIKEILIIIGYEGKAIKEYCKHIKGLTIKFIENCHYEDTNNMYSLYLAKKYAAGKSFILNNADLCIDKGIVSKLANFNSENAIAIDTSLYNEESMKVSLSATGQINDISKAIGQEKAHGCSIDFYKFSAEASSVFFKKISHIIEEQKNLKDWTEVALQSLLNQGALEFHPIDIAGDRWVEIDNYNDLALADRLFSNFDDEIKDIKNIYFDLDGTIYVGSNPVPGASEAILELKGKGKKIYYLSNNSSKNKADYVDRLKALGVDASEQEIILSTDGVIEFLKKNKVTKVYVLGTESLVSTFREHDFNVETDSPEYVIVGYDTELTYAKLVQACKYINSGVDYLATHCDAFCPSEHGPIPDIGSLVDMIKTTTKKSPVKTFGKPSADMINSIEASNSLIVGDRLHTDMLLARNIGCRGLLVLTGETSRESLDSSPIFPDFVLKTIADIYQH